MTAPNLYFVGGELEAFWAGSHSATTWSTTSGYYDPSFSRGAVILQVSDDTSYFHAPLTSSQTSCWVSFQQNRGGAWVSGSVAPNNSTWFTFVNSAGTPLYRLQGVGGSIAQPYIQMQRWNGTAWDAGTGTSLIAPINTLLKFDFKFVLATSGGDVQAWCNGVLVNEIIGNTAPVTPANIADVRFQCTSDGYGGAYGWVAISECQIMDLSTLGRRLATLGITAAGSNSAWTGGYTTVNKVGTFNDATYMQSGTAGQVSTFATGTLSTAASQYAVSGVVLAYRCLEGAVGPQNMQGAVRVGSTNYFTSNIANPALTTVFNYTWAYFTQNPATTAAWLPTDINAGIETGAQSIT